MPRKIVAKASRMHFFQGEVTNIGSDTQLKPFSDAKPGWS